MTGTSATLFAATADTRAADGPSTPDRARARLERHAAIWRKRPLTREIYRSYHRAIDAARSHVAGTDLEVGAGHGSFAEFKRDTVSCDIIPCPWLDCAADATHLPFASASLSNIIMIDVLHHVANPVGFFQEATRTLAPGGRIILLEPYVSPVSWIAWRFFHDEAIDTGTNPLADDLPPKGTQAKDPWAANIAIPTLIFWRYRRAFHERFPGLRLIACERFDMLVMPLSGGFEKRRLIPMWLAPLARAFERVLTPLTPLLAFRCLVVLEKAGATALEQCGYRVPDTHCSRAVARKPPDSKPTGRYFVASCLARASGSVTGSLHV